MWTGVAEDSRDEVAKPPPPHSAELFDFNAAGTELAAGAGGEWRPCKISGCHANWSNEVVPKLENDQIMKYQAEKLST